MKPNNDHVVLSTDTGDFLCTHCGKTYKPNLPAPINMFTAMCNEFVRTHSSCKPAMAVATTSA